MKMLIVCGAGASSTFVALRVRQSAANRGIDLEVRPASEALLDEHLVDTDVLLVGPHLADRFAAISDQAAAQAVAAVLMTEQMVTSPLGDAALDAAIAALK
ncbi:MAG: PTS sugar transporter subunit IIB [Microbacteriaceae bacterium]